ncbi:MAG: 2-phosphosulfolactate phosphatase [Planctomycetaceae bacterium]|nr:2-phosphosulfolactate phosphatase [Planctomycetaceae bacterium]
MSSLHVHFLPTLVEPDALRGGTVVVIDVLRATTTIAAAIAAGARAVIPCGELEEARQIAAKFARSEVLLGGERGGLLIPGFDLGNSPRDYLPEVVGGKTIVFTTTNGTQALLRCRQAARVLTAGFVNLSAIASAVQDFARSAHESERIHLVCAGTRGQITGEDVLLAGCLADRISAFARDADAPPPDGNDATRIALEVWHQVRDQHQRSSHTLSGGDAILERQGKLAQNLPGVLPNGIGSAMGECLGGRDLIQLGLGQDILDAAQVDRWECVPELNLQAWEIRGRA